jgi:hypothetical protein
VIGADHAVKVSRTALEPGQSIGHAPCCQQGHAQSGTGDQRIRVIRPENAQGILQVRLL